ncbi:MAG: hypothetical protein WCB04_12855, partial [Mycobacteriales bacterium]
MGKPDPATVGARVTRPTDSTGAPDGMRFNVPPGWPPPPPGWVPPPGFRPDPSWPPVPLDWLWWIPVTSGDTAVLPPPPAPGIGT